ncbi:MAG: glycosidase [Actinobacteria bacterium]|nr:MAG: glycosidase [Actinomycetota bacterium]
MPAIAVSRSHVRLRPDPLRLITKPFLPNDPGSLDGKARIERVIHRILALSPTEITSSLWELRASFGERHPDLDEVLMRGFTAVANSVPDGADLPDDLRRLIGAYFVHEYSLEGAALTNPSIVPAPDQAGVPNGSLRVIVSVRAVGEGHISSIEFRTGTVGPDGDIDLAAPGVPMTGHRRSAIFDKAQFTEKLGEMGAGDGLVGQILDRLPDPFMITDLDRVVARLRRREASSEAVQRAIQVMHWLASSNYELAFPQDSEVSQRVLFPSAPIESRGMEDARLVRFTETDGSVVYFATYTAFDGFSILPQLIETTDFQTFRLATLNGRAAQNKGIAVFPRRVGGRYAALARSDGESNYLMVSDDVRLWHVAERIQMPTHPWELVQIGNAGAPIETEAGWLVVTHGVGPLRRYALGAILLDLEDPRRVIGHLREPLLVPEDGERDGYVPNVVYSCGSLIHDARLVIAYGASDTSAGFATVEVDALLAELTKR